MTEAGKSFPRFSKSINIIIMCLVLGQTINLFSLWPNVSESISTVMYYTNITFHSCVYLAANGQGNGAPTRW